MTAYDEAILSGTMTAPQIASKYVVDASVVRVRAKKLGVTLPKASKTPPWHAKALELIAAGRTDSSVAMRLGVTRNAVACVRSNHGIEANKEERCW